MESLIKISLKDRSVEAQDGFRYPLTVKFFSLYVLLALERIVSRKGSGGFVDISYIAELPFWEKNNYLSIGKQIRRHVIEMEKLGRNIIDFVQKVNGPFRLQMELHQISLTEGIESAKIFLGLIPLSFFSLTHREETFYDYVHNIWNGDAAFNEGDLAEALMFFEKASNKGINTENTVVALHRTGRMLERIGKYDAADEIYDRARQIIKTNIRFNYLLLAENFAYHGWLNYRQKKLKKAEGSYHNALDLIRGKIHYRLQGEIHNGFGKIFEIKGEYKESLSSYQRALHCWITIAYFYGIQACYFNIGNLYKKWADKNLEINKGKLTKYAQEKYRKAIRWSKKCIRLCDRTSIGDDTSQDRILVSYCSFKLGDHDECLSYALDAKKIADNSGNVQDLAISCKILGKLHWMLGDSAKAHQHLNESIIYYHKLNNIDEVKEIRKEFGFLLDSET